MTTRSPCLDSAMNVQPCPTVFQRLGYNSFLLPSLRSVGAALILGCASLSANAQQDNTSANTTALNEQPSSTQEGSAAPTQALSDPLEAFPEAEKGFTRHVIQLPIGNFENDLRIELLPGKVEEVDCNATHYAGEIVEKTLDGWGYNYYLLPEVKGPVSTMMACPDDSKRRQFVPVSSPGSLLHYNSRLPVVVYLPDGFELRWRTWVATPVISAPPY